MSDANSKQVTTDNPVIMTKVPRAAAVAATLVHKYY